MQNGVSYVAATILLTVYGQLIIKWQMSDAGSLPSDPSEKLRFLLSMLLNPWVLSAFAAAFLASLAWMAAMTKFKLSDAYPFTSLSFVLVMVCSALCFGESLTPTKVAGTALVIMGLVAIAR